MLLQIRKAVTFVLPKLVLARSVMRQDKQGNTTGFAFWFHCHGEGSDHHLKSRIAKSFVSLSLQSICSHSFHAFLQLSFPF